MEKVLTRSGKILTRSGKVAHTGCEASCCETEVPEDCSDVDFNDCPALLDVTVTVDFSCFEKAGTDHCDGLTEFVFQMSHDVADFILVTNSDPGGCAPGVTAACEFGHWESATGDACILVQNAYLFCDASGETPVWRLTLTIGCVIGDGSYTGCGIDCGDDDPLATYEKAHDSLTCDNVEGTYALVSGIGDHYPLSLSVEIA